MCSFIGDLPQRVCCPMLAPHSDRSADRASLTEAQLLSREATCVRNPNALDMGISYEVIVSSPKANMEQIRLRDPEHGPYQHFPKATNRNKEMK